MNCRTEYFGCCFVVLVCTLVVLPGCGGGASSLPDQITVTFPDGTTAPAVQGAGVPSLANSSWQFFRASATGQGARFATINFGPNGNMESFGDNTLGAAILGDEIIFDGVSHPTGQPGVEYAAATFGAEKPDGSAFAFEGRLTVFSGGLQFANGSAAAAGTFDPDDPDTMTGDFAFVINITIPIAIPGLDTTDLNDEFNFIATRVQ